MKLYQITLPACDTHGDTYHPVTFSHWQHRCLDVAGGFTLVTECAFGLWRDAEGAEHTDWSRIYQVACEPDAWAELLACAKRLWHDQACLAVATLGDFELV